MKISRKALMVIDIQPGLINDNTRHILEPVKNLLTNSIYDAYVEATFSAPEKSIWDKQMRYTFPNQPTLPEISTAIPRSRYIRISKTTKSAFKGDGDVLAFFRNYGIEEVHIVGLDANDCVLATAYESFDLGFLTYVIKECVAASQSKEACEAAVHILDELDMVKGLSDVI